MTEYAIAHSFSKLDTFDTCPKSYEAKNITKEVKFEGNEFSKYGDRAHTAMEERIMMNAMLPDEFADYEPVAKSVLAFSGEKFCELQLAIGKDMQPMEWFGKPWMRGIIDFLCIDGCYARMLDWKTGKQKDTLDELKIFALLVFAHYPQVHVVQTGYVWFKTGKVVKETFNRAQIPHMLSEVIPKTERVEHAVINNKFIPTPNGLCKKYCEVKSCVFHGKGAR